MFLHVSVILFTGGGLPHCMLGYPPGPEAGTPREQTHSPGPGTPQSSACWEIRATSGRYASYWDVFLFKNKVNVNISNFARLWKSWLSMVLCHFSFVLKRQVLWRNILICANLIYLLIYCWPADPFICSRIYLELVQLMSLNELKWENYEQSKDPFTSAIFLT